MSRRKELGREAPEGGIGGGAANVTPEVTLRVDADAAPKLAFAAENSTLRLVLRPQNGEKVDRIDLVSFASLLIGAKPVKLPKGNR